MSTISAHQLLYGVRVDAGIVRTLEYDLMIKRFEWSAAESGRLWRSAKKSRTVRRKQGECHGRVVFFLLFPRPARRPDPSALSVSTHMLCRRSQREVCIIITVICAHWRATCSQALCPHFSPISANNHAPMSPQTWQNLPHKKEKNLAFRYCERIFHEKFQN